MIFEVIQIIAEQVNNYLEEMGLEKTVAPENIAFLEFHKQDSDTPLKDRVALTLINLEEDATLKNFPNHTIENTKTVYKNSTVNVNLYILFSANRTKYIDSLQDISKIIEFFQGKKLFTQANTIYDKNSSGMCKVNDFRFAIDLYTPTFEELNYIWGTLGGKQLPSALYKVSMIQMQRNIPKEDEQLFGKITEITKRKEQ